MAFQASQTIYVIAGPTASGKTALAIELAKRLETAIISADSMQVYIGMDIGTAKPTLKEQQGIPHFLIDIKYPNQTFSVAEFETMASYEIDGYDTMRDNPHIPPIVVGGTGFYINALIYGADFSKETTPASHTLENQLRDKYHIIAEEKGAEFIHKKLQILDPDAAKNIHPNNIKRVVRAISYCESRGALFSAQNAEKKVRSARYDVKFIVLELERQLLYKRINERVLTMWENGLVEEVRGLLAKGYHDTLPSMRSIGYKETTRFINGECSEDETINAIQQATRNYAKRQQTWFRHQNSTAQILNVSGKNVDTLIKEILNTGSNDILQNGAN